MTITLVVFLVGVRFGILVVDIVPFLLTTSICFRFVRLIVLLVNMGVECLSMARSDPLSGFY